MSASMRPKHDYGNQCMKRATCSHEKFPLFHLKFSLFVYLLGSRVGKKTGFFGLNLFFFGLNQVFFPITCVFMNENSRVLEQLITILITI